jgi:hypothetical protein
MLNGEIFGTFQSFKPGFQSGGFSQNRPSKTDTRPCPSKLAACGPAAFGNAMAVIMQQPPFPTTMLFQD